MNDTVLAALLGLLVAGLGGLLVPALIASVPEPDAQGARARGAGGSPEEDAPLAEPAADEPPKMLYADIAARPGLRGRSALVSAASGAWSVRRRGWTGRCSGCCR